MKRKDELIFYLSGTLLSINESIRNNEPLSEDIIQSIRGSLEFYVDCMPMDKITREDYKKELGL